MDSTPTDKPAATTPGPEPETPEGSSVPVLDPDLPAPSEPPVLSYNPKKLRIQVTITRKHCTESPTPPADLIARAREKMLAVEKSGKVALFTIYERRFEHTWTKFRELDAANALESVTIVLAAGAPALPGLEIKPSLSQDSLATLSIRAGANEVAEWQLDWLKQHVLRALSERGIEEHPSPTQIHGALVRARSGHIVQDLAVKRLKLSSPKDGQIFHLAVNQARKEVGLVIFDIDAVADLRRVEERIAGVEKTIGKLSGSKKGTYRILRRELLEAIEAALCGPERLGLELPLTMLAAIDPTSKTTQKAGSMPAPRHQSADDPRRNQPLLTFAISNDRMAATITGCSPSLAAKIARLNDEWLRGELQKAGIKHGVRTGLFDDIRKQLAGNLHLGSLGVALGTPAEAGQAPYLHLVTQEQEGTSSSAMRAYRRHSLVKAGQLIAEIRYKNPPVLGRDVTGRDLPPPAGEALPDPVLGEGVEKRASGRFYAAFGGIAGYDEQGTLCLTKMLVHEGNANLASGDIVFDGPVEIKGNIDSGGNVKVSGDLLVRGEICGGKIDCGGNITVERGIVVGPGGSVRARGDVKADFIENSTVICGGALSVARSIMQANIMAGGAITVTGADGLIGGGTFACGNLLKTTNLGLPDGSRTEINAGVNFKAEFSTRLRQGRLETLVKLSDEERRAFKDLMKKPAAKLSKTEKDAKDRLRDRITRWGGIIDAARLHLEKVSAHLTYDNEARIYVTGKLSANCQIRLGGKVIPITREVTSVMITTLEEDGSFLKPHSGDGPKAKGKADKS